MDVDERVRARAKRLWEEEGRPNVPHETYLDKASELIAIEDSHDQTTEPIGAYTSNSAGHEPVEPIEAAENQGDMPTLTDQGEEETFPEHAQIPAKAPVDHRD